MGRRQVARRRREDFPLESSGSNPVEREGKMREGKRKKKGEKREEEKRSEKLHILFKIDGDRIVGFRQSKRQSPST